MRTMYFTASWCAACKTYGPLVHKLCNELEIEYDAIDVGDRPAEAAEYDVTSLPTLIATNGDRLAGAYPESGLRAWLIAHR